MDNQVEREPRPEKVAVVDEVRERFASADAALLTEYRGLTVGELAALRRTLRESGTDYKVYKNTLVRRAADQAGLADLQPLLTGPTAIAFVSGDAAIAAKTLRDFAKTAPALVIKGGLLGTRFLSPDDASALAELPSRDVLLARLAGGLAAPMQKFAGLLQALPRNFAYGLSALIEKGGAPGAPAAAPEAAPASEVAEAAPASDVPEPAPADVPETVAPVEAPETLSPAEEPAPAPAEPDTTETPEAPAAPEATASESETPESENQE
jgi:large subunit ribosomal protein L10